MSSYGAYGTNHSLGFYITSLDSSYTYVRFIYRLSTTSSAYYTDWILASSLSTNSSGYLLYTIEDGETRVRASTDDPWTTASISPNTAYVVNVGQATSSTGTGATNIGSKNVTTGRDLDVELTVYKLSDSQVRIDINASNVSVSDDCNFYYKKSTSSTWTQYGNWFHVQNGFKSITLTGLNYVSYDFWFEDEDEYYDKYIYNIPLNGELLIAGFKCDPSSWEGEVTFRLKNVTTSGNWYYDIRDHSSADISTGQWSTGSFINLKFTDADFEYGMHYDIRARHRSTGSTSTDYVIFLTNINCAPPQGGEIRDFSHETWNAIVHSVYRYRGASNWLSTYATIDNTYINTNDLTLTAAKFNSLWLNLRQLNSDMGAKTWNSGDEVSALRFYDPDESSTGYACLNDGMKKMQTG